MLALGDAIDTKDASLGEAFKYRSLVRESNVHPPSTKDHSDSGARNCMFSAWHGAIGQRALPPKGSHTTARELSFKELINS